MIADGFLVKEFWPYGRLAQSIAFFSPPGIERLYSGVTKRTASTAAMADLKSFATLENRHRSHNCTAADHGTRFLASSAPLAPSRQVPWPTSD